MNHISEDGSKLRALWVQYARHQPNCTIRKPSLNKECDCGYELACLESGLLIKRLEAWRDAIIDATVVDWVYVKEHDDNPRKAIGDLCQHAAKLALDPAVSQEAAEWQRRITELEAQVAEAQAKT